MKYGSFTIEPDEDVDEVGGAGGGRRGWGTDTGGGVGHRCRRVAANVPWWWSMRMVLVTTNAGRMAVCVKWSHGKTRPQVQMVAVTEVLLTYTPFSVHGFQSGNVWEPINFPNANRALQTQFWSVMVL